MADRFTQYEEGLKLLLERLESDLPSYHEALVLESRLRESISETRRYGDSENSRVERSKIIDQLNRLARQTIEVDFNRLCQGCRAGLGAARLPSRLPPMVFKALAPTPNFCGRETELEKLSTVWDEGEASAIAITGAGGLGKSTLVRRFLDLRNWLNEDEPRRPEGIFVWSFDGEPNVDRFFSEACAYFQRAVSSPKGIPLSDKQANELLLVSTLKNSRGLNLIVLDGLERIQYADPEPEGFGGLPFPLMHLLKQIVDNACGNTRILITSRLPLVDLQNAHV